MGVDPEEGVHTGLQGKTSALSSSKERVLAFEGE